MGDGDGAPGDGDGDGVPGDGDGVPGDGDGDGDGAPSFAGPLVSEVSAFDDFRLGDLDLDGCADLLLHVDATHVAIVPGDCDGSFIAMPLVHTVTAHLAWTLGDLDGDGRADLLLQPSAAPMQIRAHLLADAFALAPAVDSNIYPHDRLWTADLDGDGRDDAISWSQQTDPLTLNSWISLGEGSLVLLDAAEVGSFDLAAFGALDADGFADAITGLGEVAVLNPWLGDGTGNLASGTLLWPPPLTKLALGDVDGDGLDDLLCDRLDANWRVDVRVNLGGGEFAERIEVAAVSYSALRTGDVDADGDDDIAIAPLGLPPRVMVWLSK